MEIVIADDHALVRVGLGACLRELTDGVEILEAENVSQVRELTAAHSNIVLVLLDFKMPGMGDFSGLRTIREENPEIPVAILSAVNEPWAVREALDNGAAGYISKTASNEVVVGAIKLMLAGGIYLPPSLLGNFEPDTSGATPPEGKGGALPGGSASAGAKGALTARQTEVLEVLRQGKSNKEIARDLGIAEGTVKKHVTAILRVLDVSNRGRAICAPRTQTL